jgi:hypothetical protein
MRGVYLFKGTTGNKVKVNFKKTVATLKEDITIQLVKGQVPDSKEEFYVSLALEQFELDYLYQYEIFDGRERKGGQVLDFLVFTTPLMTPLLVMGEYWHRNKDQEAYRIARIRTYFKGSAFDPVLLWTKDLATVDMAYETVKRELKL